jgi:hypothetical protein
MTETIVHRFCFQCDQERAIDPETFRCQTCGKPTARGEVVERLRAETAVRTNGTAVSAPAEPLELPNTAAMRKWIDQMHAPRIEPKALSSGDGKRWARGFDACIDCGRSSVKHIAHGRCATCDYNWRTKGSPS